MDRIKVGEKYGRLTVLENHHPKDEVVCRCECGNIKIARATNVFYGGTRSCGCLQKEGNNLKHGDRYTRLYGIWKGMRERCNTPSQNRYKNYGGRGIKVCKEWDDFSAFKEWALDNGYDDNLTIDRIDVDGNYEPDNCRWATYKQQSNNKTNNHYISFNGKVQTITEWSEEIGISLTTIYRRLKEGKSLEEVFKKWVSKNNHKSSSDRRSRTLYKPIDGEVWVEYSDEPSLLVSNLGRVMDADNLTILSPIKKQKGHLEICYYYRSYLLNRMVASCFIDNPNGFKYVLHKDGNKENNNADNLVWSNHKYFR